MYPAFYAAQSVGGEGGDLFGCHVYDYYTGQCASTRDQNNRKYELIRLRPKSKYRVEVV